MNEKPKVLLYELDSGSWNVLKPLLSKGQLPNINRLMNEGVYGVLMSDSPPISPRIWTTIFTGKHSQKHGVEFFASTSSMVRQKRLWDILNERGFKVGVFGSLVTWPPYRINGFMIPSIFSLGSDTYPEEYQVLQEVALSERKKLHKGEDRSAIKRIKTLINRSKRLKSIGVTSETLGAASRYIIREKLLGFHPRDRYWRKASLYLQMTVDVFNHLYKKYNPDFATFHNHLCDVISHRYWDCYEPQHFQGVPSNLIKKYGRVIPDSYILSDNLLGNILESIDSSTTVIIVSDHGAKPIINTLKPYNINFDNFLRILQVQDSVIPARFGVKSILYFTDIKVRNPILELVQSMAIEGTGERIFKVESNEQYVSLSPVPQLFRRDIPGETPIRINGFGTHPFSELFTYRKLKISGLHHKEGIFIACGPNIKSETELKNATIFDITPTLLALMGNPVAKDMDGRVLTEIIDEKYLSANPVKYIESYEDGVKPGTKGEEKVDIEKIKDRLSSLGYL